MSGLNYDFMTVQNVKWSPIIKFEFVRCVSALTELDLKFIFVCILGIELQ